MTYDSHVAHAGAAVAPVMFPTLRPPRKARRYPGAACEQAGRNIHVERDRLLQLLCALDLRIRNGAARMPELFAFAP